jgi:hypothetical protein
LGKTTLAEVLGVDMNELVGFGETTGKTVKRRGKK